MKTKTLPTIGLFFLFAFFLSLATLQASESELPSEAFDKADDIYYVDASSTASDPDGLSWATAFKDIQSAVDIAAEKFGGQVWVAKGNYTGAKEPVLTMKSRVFLYGGFSGSEFALEQRDWETNISTIDGENQRLCVRGANNAGLDGFTVTRGFTNRDGGGMRNDYSASPTITNCFFIANTCGIDTGGGIYNSGPSTTITNCFFIANTADNIHGGAGGGIYNNGSSATITNCFFIANTADKGGAIYNSSGDLKVINSIFTGNTANKGGGLCSKSGKALITNCVFTENRTESSHGQGGGIHLDSNSDTDVLNCTFANNTASEAGGGIFNSGYASDKLKVANSVLWGNLPDQITGTQFSATSVSFSCIEGRYTGDNNIARNPEFLNAPYSVQLRPESPCIGKGTTENAPDNDLLGRSRQGAIDMGAYQGAVSDSVSLNVRVSPENLGKTEPPANEHFFGPGERIILQVYGTGGRFSKWEGDTLENRRYPLITLTENKTLVAEFEENIFRVNVKSRDEDPDGRSWATAYPDLQSAVDAAFASGGGEIWVAKGTYKSSLPTIVTMKEEVSLYGGFSGNERMREERNWEAHETKVDGENKRQCILGSSNARLDGFIAMRGKSNGQGGGIQGEYGGGMYNGSCSSLIVENCSFEDNVSGGMYNSSTSSTSIINCKFSSNITPSGTDGGGMYNNWAFLIVESCFFESNHAGSGGGIYNHYSMISLENCIFEENEATGTSVGISAGGGIYNHYSSPTISHCIFTKNKARNAGGGMFNHYSSATVIECSFTENIATEGGGMKLIVGSPTVLNCSFDKNSANSSGGGMYISSSSSPKVLSCRFSKNTAEYGGGGIYNKSDGGSLEDGLPKIQNCLFTENEVYSGRSDSAGGLDSFSTSSMTVANCTFTQNKNSEDGCGALYLGSNVTVTNCIAWGNSPTRVGSRYSIPIITYSCIEGGFKGAGNIDADPLFVNAPQNLRLQSGSSCIDTGTDSDAPDTDISGRTRPYGAGYDMGAYEYYPGASIGIDLQAHSEYFHAVADHIYYTITVKNTGGEEFTDIEVTHSLTGEKQWVGTLAPGGEKILNEMYTVTQSDMESYKVENTVTVEGKLPDGTTMSATDTKIVEFAMEPDLSITLDRHSPTFSKVGEEINFTIAVKNTGNVPIHNIVVEDGLTSLIQTISTLAPGEERPFDTSYEVVQLDLDRGKVENTASVSGKAPNGVPVSKKTQLISVDAIWNPDLSITMDRAPSSFSEVGEEITFTITVKNTGNVTLNNIVVEDDLTGLSEGIRNLVPGDYGALQTSYKVTQSDLDTGKVGNTATVSGKTPDNSLVPESTDFKSIDAVWIPDLSIAIDPDLASFSEIDEEINFTITVKNTGNVTLRDIVVEDDLTGFSEGIRTLAPGNGEVLATSYKVTQSDLDTGKVENTITVSGKAPDNTPVPEKTDSKSVKGIAIPKLTVIKTGDKARFSEVDEEITYTIGVTNTGNVTLSDVVVEDLLTEFTESIRTLAPGDGEMLETSYKVKASDVKAREVVNTVTVEGRTPDGTEVQDEDTEVATFAEIAEVTVTKTPDVSEFSTVGNKLNYIIQVKNTGDFTLNDIIVEDPLTGFHEQIETLAPDEEEILETSYEVTQSDMDRGGVENTVNVAGTASNGSTVEDTDTVFVNAITNPELSISMDTGVSSFSSVGEIIDYTITIENTGNVMLKDVVVEDSLTGFERTITTLASGSTETFPTTYAVKQSDLDNGQVTNTVNVTGKTLYDDEVLDTDTKIATAVMRPGLMVIKTPDVSSLPMVGEKINYTITVENTGNVTLSDVIVRDSLTDFYYQISKLEPKFTETLFTSYEVTQSDAEARKVVNTVVVKGEAPNGTMMSTTDTSTVVFVAAAKLDVRKQADVSVISYAGDKITYTIEITNTGNLSLSNVVVEDPLTGFKETIATLLPGSVVTRLTSLEAKQKDIDAGSLVNTVKVTGRTSSGGVVSGTDSITVDIVKDPQLSVSKTANIPTFSAVGDNIYYTIKVTNNGNVTLNNIILEDPLTGLNRKVSTLLPGENISLETYYTVKEKDVVAGKVTNVATVTGKDPSGKSLYDTSTADVVASTAQLLSVTKSADQTALPAAGKEINYTILVKNTGDVVLSNIVVKDPLTGFNETIATLAPGDKTSLETNYAVTNKDVEKGEVVNTVTVTGKDLGGNSVQDSDTITIKADDSKSDASCGNGLFRCSSKDMQDSEKDLLGDLLLLSLCFSSLLIFGGLRRKY
ncbi:MAG: DUF11 domain-containing protein [Candidatus Hydrogenedens sp.]|nr:DUF11 domain-containing protein [Candidatus Hydrogenedens sp.]